MNTINMPVLKEVVLCKACQRPVTFLRISDFAYGEWLTQLSDTKQYAYTNVQEFARFNEYTDMIDGILEQFNANVSKLQYTNTAYRLYGVTCDNINGHSVDFFPKKRVCEFCGSQDLDNLLFEPESVTTIDAFIITHEDWEKLSVVERVRKLTYEMIARGMIDPDELRKHKHET